MARITRDELNKWNQDNKNGFQFDIFYYLTHTEKTISKRIQLDEQHYLSVHIMYRNEFIQHKNEYGCTWSTESGRSIPCVHFAYEFRKGDVFVSNGLGYWQNMGEPVDKRNYKALQKLTEKLPDYECQIMFDNLFNTQVNQYA